MGFRRSRSDFESLYLPKSQPQLISSHHAPIPKPLQTSEAHSDNTLPPVTNLPESFYQEQDLFRFRKQRGVNLGSWFVLERWISDGPFRSAAQPAQSDLDVARGKNAKSILEDHWNNWITEADWAWLKDRGFNAVRIPIGYYHLAGLDPSLLEGTDFHEFTDVFVNAWAKIQEAFELAYKPTRRSRQTKSRLPLRHFQRPHLLLLQTQPKPHHTHPNHPPHTPQPLPPLTQPTPPNLIGIELLNEPHPPSDPSLQSWYTTTIKKLRSVDATIPVYIGECWRVDSYADWLVKSGGAGASGTGLTVLDHHLYRCFTSSDISTSAQVHARALDPDSEGQGTPQHFSSVSEKLGQVPGGGSGLVIGEWSGALNPGSLQSSTSGGWEETKQYIDAQLRLYDKTCAGYFFWTFKKQHPGDKGWSLRDAVGAGTFPDRIGLRLTTSSGEISIEPDEVAKAKSATKGAASESHRKWWSQFPGKYEHGKFDDGFDKGWDEALRFLTFDLNGRDSLSELGFTRAWARRQTKDHRGNYWEYEHGFLQAVNEARNFFSRRYGFT
ncbi:hypothetical protein D9756_002033 [Leucocoprinus leucothites]|uniref:Glycoside hydrolase family 5 domain-containing protein n=1 Tax=Leucocoprinus leucothites TaxID=201217 RepID=A0A8H5GBD2_9AGAR|nr:hypothetical protein D9756_002033 [Leucoagaricus leucothites]